MFFKKKPLYKVIYKNTGRLHKQNKKEAFKEGTKIKITFLIATDESYSIKLDGESVNWEYAGEGGLVEFIMPNHDVYVEFNSKNDMEYVENK